MLRTKIVLATRAARVSEAAPAARATRGSSSSANNRYCAALETAEQQRRDAIAEIGKESWTLAGIGTSAIGFAMGSGSLMIGGSVFTAGSVCIDYYKKQAAEEEHARSVAIAKSVLEASKV
jgi:hypothetical protein